MESADKPGSVVDSHSSGICVTTYLMQPTREQCGPHHCSPIWSCSEWGLPSPPNVTTDAVRSYRTFSPLPASRRYPFCCTFRRLTPPRCYLALCPWEPGLSSRKPRFSSDCLADSREYYTCLCMRVLTSGYPAHIDKGGFSFHR